MNKHSSHTCNTGNIQSRKILIKIFSVKKHSIKRSRRENGLVPKFVVVQFKGFVAEREDGAAHIYSDLDL